jgi:flagellar L-ring protein precursor FlgH
MSPHGLAARLGLVLLGLTLLGGCSAAQRLQQIGETPPLTTIQDPHAQPGYRPVSLPMPAPIVGERRPNSLWQAGSRAFFKDQRASQVGDILTVLIHFDEKAKFNNETSRARTAAESETIPGLFGFQGQIQKILPKSADMSNLVNATGNSNHDGKAAINREEQIDLQVAALVTQVLPNGNLVIQGRQEIRVNYEVRELQVTGVLRQQDISSTNTVSYDKLAEARIAYGGRGQLMDVQQPRYGQQLLDIIAPF